jgi:hypothetical protein
MLYPVEIGIISYEYSQAKETQIHQARRISRVDTALRTAEGNLSHK